MRGAPEGVCANVTHNIWLSTSRSPPTDHAHAPMFLVWPIPVYFARCYFYLYFNADELSCLCLSLSLAKPRATSTSSAETVLPKSLPIPTFEPEQQIIILFAFHALSHSRHTKGTVDCNSSACLTPLIKHVDTVGTLSQGSRCPNPHPLEVRTSRFLVNHHKTSGVQ